MRGWQAKATLSRRLERRLCGIRLRPHDDREEKIFRLVAEIESEFPRPGIQVRVAAVEQHDAAALTQSVVAMVVQVNGKVRAKIEVPADAQQASIIDLAKAQDNVARHLDGKSVVKEIVVPSKLVNIVVR